MIPPLFLFLQAPTPRRPAQPVLFSRIIRFQSLAFCYVAKKPRT
jgi:hypothetical protein